MGGGRKYSHRGYMEPDRDYGENRLYQERRPQGPRQPIDVTGPRLPRMVQSVTAARCYNCATALPAGVDFRDNCPRCNVPLHCCKQCAHFEPSHRFQCLKPISARVPAKDKANDCELFETRVTVARDAAPGGSSPAVKSTDPKTAEDARAAFDNLFKNKS